MMTEVTIDREAFNEKVQTLTLANAERIALAFPDLFAHTYEFKMPGADSEHAAKMPPRPGSGADKKPRGPRPQSMETIGSDMLKSNVLAAVKEKPGLRSEDYAGQLNQNGIAVRKTLTKLVDDGLVRQEGERRGAKFSPVEQAAEASE